MGEVTTVYNCSEQKSKITMKILGAALYLGIIVGAAATVGVHLSYDILTFVAPGGVIVFLGN